jgi:hypothetical protein
LRGAVSDRGSSTFASRLNLAAQNCTVLNDETGTRDVSFHRSAASNFNLVVSGDRSKYASKDHDDPGGDIRTHGGVWSNGQRVLRQMDASIHLAINGQIFGTGYFPFHEHGSPQLRHSSLIPFSGLTV